MITEADRIALIAATLRECAACWRVKRQSDGSHQLYNEALNARAAEMEREAERLRDSEKPFRDAETMAVLRNMRAGTSEAEQHRGAQVTDKTEAWDFRSPRAQEQPAANGGDSGGRDDDALEFPMRPAATVAKCVAPAEFDALIAKAARAEAAEKALAEETQHCDWLRKELAGVREDVKGLIGHAEAAEKALAEERGGAGVAGGGAGGREQAPLHQPNALRRPFQRVAKPSGAGRSASLHRPPRPRDRGGAVMTLYLAWLRGHDRRPYPVVLGDEPHLGGYDARHMIGKPIPLPDSFADRTVDEAVEYVELSMGVTAP